MPVLVISHRVSTLARCADGIVLEDLRNLWAGTLTLNVRARAPGLDASAVRVRFSGSSDLVISPPSEVPLQANLPDLQPRNHYYVTAGVHSLPVTFTLDTTQLPDGHHELTAVAYEGSNVRSQTSIRMPVQVRNSSLNATIELSEADGVAPVDSACTVRVIANAQDVSAITLHSTGGPIAIARNSTNAVFEASGSFLAPGLHPLYALVETTSGMEYRTETKWIRFTR